MSKVAEVKCWFRGRGTSPFTSKGILLVELVDPLKRLDNSLSFTSPTVIVCIDPLTFSSVTLCLCRGSGTRAQMGSL